MNAQVGAITRGTYTLKIVDPILFVRNWVPATYLEPGRAFDFTDIENDAAAQLFNEVVGSLAPAFSMLTSSPPCGQCSCVHSLPLPGCSAAPCMLR